MFRLATTLALASSLLVACQASASKYHKDARALGPYSSAVEFAGTVVLSGKIAATDQRGGSFADEATSTIDRIQAQLEELGLGLDDVVSATVYLTDMERYAEFNEIYGARFLVPYPARVCVAVAALPGGAQVEIQVVARRP